jgi:hypothetical protein
VELKLQSLQSLHLPMLDWTTSFLSDAYIINLSGLPVKLFLARR